MSLAGLTQRVNSVIGWPHAMGFAKVIGRKQLLKQSHLDRSEMTCLLDWVTPGSTLTAPDGRVCFW